MLAASAPSFSFRSMYSIMENPMTACGCFECISAILPMTNGIMIVDRDHPDMTPCGMKFSTLAGSVGGLLAGGLLVLMERLVASALTGGTALSIAESSQQLLLAALPVLGLLLSTIAVLLAGLMRRTSTRA